MNKSNNKFVIGRHSDKSIYEMKKIFDNYGININCMGCLLSSNKLGIETDCQDCDYYMENVLEEE